MEKKLLKWFSMPLIIIAMMLVSCENMDLDPFHDNTGLKPYHEDGAEITAAEAVEIVKPIIHKYAEEGYFWRISKVPVPSRTTLKYGPFGNYDPSSKYSGKFKSPGYKAWLILFWNPMIDGLSNNSICLFVDTRTGNNEEVSISGEVSGIEWAESY